MGEALKNTLEREARHLTDTDSTTTTTDSQLKTQHQTGVGKCHPNGVQHTPTGGYKICLHAGHIFDCEVNYERTDPACMKFECGAGKVIKLRASGQVCLQGSTGTSPLQASGTFLSTWPVRDVALEPHKCVNSVAGTPQDANLSTTSLTAVVTSPRERVDSS